MARGFGSRTLEYFAINADFSIVIIRIDQTVATCGSDVRVFNVDFDHDGIYYKGLFNDRLLLGLKGAMSEFEISLLRQRAIEAYGQKATGSPTDRLWSPQEYEIEGRSRERIWKHL